MTNFEMVNVDAHESAPPDRSLAILTARATTVMRERLTDYFIDESQSRHQIALAKSDDELISLERIVPSTDFSRETDVEYLLQLASAKTGEHIFYWVENGEEIFSTENGERLGRDQGFTSAASDVDRFSGAVVSAWGVLDRFDWERFQWKPRVEAQKSR